MLVDVAFIALWCIFPVFWYILLQRAGLSFFRVSIPSFLIVLIVLQQYLGLPALYFELDSYRANLVGSRDNTLTIFFYTSAVITIILFGFIAAKTTMGNIDSPHMFNSYHECAVAAPKRELSWIVFLFAVGGLVLIRYIQVLGFDNIALFAALGENMEQMEIYLLRSRMGNDFQGSHHWYRLFMIDILTLSSLSLYANYLVQSGRANLLLFGLSFIAVSLSTLVATEKAPFLWFLVSLYLVRVLLLFNGLIPVRKLPALIVPIFVLVSVLYVLFMGAEDSAEAFSHGLSRGFLGSIAPLGAYLDTFPDKVDFLYGRSFANPGEIFPFEHYRLTVEINKLLKPELAALGIVGTSPTIFWGETHANFGFGGSVVFSFLIGFGVYAVASLIARLHPSPIVVGLTVWGALFFSKLSVTSVSNYIPPTSFLILVSISLVGLFISGQGKIRFAGRRVFQQRKSLRPDFGT
jgi:hypothetical protein